MAIDPDKFNQLLDELDLKKFLLVVILDDNLLLPAYRIQSQHHTAAQTLAGKQTEAAAAVLWIQIVSPGKKHWENLSMAGDLITVSPLTARAIAYQADIASAEHVFARYKALRCFNPLKV